MINLWASVPKVSLGNVTQEQRKRLNMDGYIGAEYETAAELLVKVQPQLD